jgi:hypothetical protein
MLKWEEIVTHVHCKFSKEKTEVISVEGKNEKTDTETNQTKPNQIKQSKTTKTTKTQPQEENTT